MTQTTTSDVFVRFVNAEGARKYVSVRDILGVGEPMDDLTDEPMELDTHVLFDEQERPL